MSELTADERAELEALRARVADLERERTEQIAASNAALAAYQERVYWLDRWQVDLNAMMGKPGAAEFRAAIRLVRGAIRRVRLVKRSLLG